MRFDTIVDPKTSFILKILVNLELREGKKKENSLKLSCADIDNFP